jgi:hypothetical protein
MNSFPWMKIGVTVALSLVALAGCRKGAAPNGTAPGTPIEMTATQKLGVALVTDISAHPSLQGSRISVGTSEDSVTLVGVVRTAAQKKSAEALARKKAPGYKIVNRLKVDPKLPAPTAAAPIKAKAGEKCVPCGR